MAASSSSKTKQSKHKPQKVKKQLLDLSLIDWDEYYFDEEAASRIVDFARTFIKHVKAQWAGKGVEFDDWQEKIVRTFYGWKKRKNGLRRFRTLYLEVPRKNGKSFLGSIIALYQLLADHEFGAEVYSAATDKKQAKLVFKTACDMLDFAPILKRRCKVTKEGIEVPATKSVYVPLSAEAYTKDGLNASAIVFDELHAQPNRDLYDVLRTSMNARLQPVEVYITTAGKDVTGIGYEVHEYAEKIISGILTDDSFLGIIYAAKPEDDWKDEAVHIKANPGWGKSVIPDNFRSELRKAINMPSSIPTFKRLYLNIWTEAGQGWMPHEKWVPLGESYTEADLYDRPCWIGVDLSKRIDITALTAYFPDDDGITFRSITVFWMPADRAQEREEQDRIKYKEWAKLGHLRLTEGEVVDFDEVIQEIVRMRKIFKVQEVALDPWAATQINTALDKLDIEHVEFRQGYQSMSPAMKDLEALIYQKRYRHPNNPLMNWMISNVKIAEDPAGNIKPDKKKSSRRIDGPVSLIMAAGRCHAALGLEQNPYDDRGFIIL